MWTIWHVPRLPVAPHHDPVVPLGAGHHLRVLPQVERHGVGQHRDRLGVAYLFEQFEHLRLALFTEQPGRPRVSV
jgi:hypothetical protein